MTEAQRLAAEFTRSAKSMRALGELLGNEAPNCKRYEAAAALLLKQEAALKLAEDALNYVIARNYQFAENALLGDALTAIKELNK